ncbi:hypothetical protein FQA47_010915 [Oryzias melastigma]|uniref:Uncharacterized protein n=1 Tax=Oryzias melastigma TaxID=30732 RepID=A0A834C6L1_ORYME|nr:hypothetical protein FQA47_010915 [Oryzias melastigma]
MQFWEINVCCSSCLFVPQTKSDAGIASSCVLRSCHALPPTAGTSVFSQTSHFGQFGVEGRENFGGKIKIYQQKADTKNLPYFTFLSSANPQRSKTSNPFYLQLKRLKITPNSVPFSAKLGGGST